jgi:hypothetical protein
MPEKLLLSALEHMLHHRGQLYVYLRLMGIEPVFVWSGEPTSVVLQKWTGCLEDLLAPKLGRAVLSPLSFV